MQTQKLSVSIPQPLYEFVEQYQAKHQSISRSQVITEALRLLQELQLEAEYREASQEVDPLFESTNMDGLDDETW